MYKYFKKLIKFLKYRYPLLLNIYYQFRFVFRALYLKEPRAHLLWIIKRGDKKAYKNFDLNTESIFFDVGGFKGDYTEKILKQYNCKSFVFEPHKEYFEEIKRRYSKNENVRVFNYGLGAATEELFLIDSNDGSKVTSKKTEIKIVIKDVVEVIQELGIKKIDLLKLNIEGSEYDLLDRLINSQEIKIIDKLKIQFHENIPNYIIRRENIRKRLNITHKEMWSYYFVWERWDLR
jgi:FkbM family methyltransferase